MNKDAYKKGSIMGDGMPSVGGETELYLRENSEKGFFREQ